MRKALFGILFLLSTAVLYAQSDSSYDYFKKIPAADLKKDLIILKDSQEIVHPALYRFSSKQSFDAAFEQAVRQVDRPMTQTEFYRIVAPLIAGVGDIHSTIDVPDEALNYIASQGWPTPCCGDKIRKTRKSATNYCDCNKEQFR